MTIFSATDWVVEPANVHLIKCVTSINIANYARNRCLPPIDCTASAPEGHYYDKPASNPCLINATGITGAVTLIPGFNCNIYEQENSFTIEGLKGGGASLTEPQSSDIPMNAEEAEAIANGESLDGCVMCDETIKSINGLTGNNINIQGGAGISVIPGDHEITIRFEEQQASSGCLKDNPNLI